MALCEMCGRTGEMLRALVEGVELSVCQICVKHGQLQKNQNLSSFRSAGYHQQGRRSSSSPPRQEKEWKVVEDFFRLLRSARERSKLSQEDFAVLLQERESVVNKWEAGTVKPSLETAKKLQKLLGLTLVVVDEFVGEEIVSARKSDELTLGDFMKMRSKRTIH